MELFIMTAPIQTGKTTWVGKMIEAAEEQGLTITGLRSPAIFEGGEKTGIQIELLPSHRIIDFATKLEWDLSDPSKRPNGKTRMGWDFKQEAFDIANAHLETCKADFGDLFIVDEFGWVEFFKGEGYTTGLEIMDAALAPRVLLVLRPDLVKPAQERWGKAELLSPASDMQAFIHRLKL